MPTFGTAMTCPTMLAVTLATFDDVTRTPETTSPGCTVVELMVCEIIRGGAFGGSITGAGLADGWTCGAVVGAWVGAWVGDGVAVFGATGIAFAVTVGSADGTAALAIGLGVLAACCWVG